ncbi:hypothetical protein LSH36_795g00081 [Paralvinella palmiformis]|uniref:Uncharacterized protein n=1 Tax=Paralvinella palmiformis TaxID=53620 RepID=A0AAD9MSC2_9ANNE|nr:hypothetical protein LSH36_795g00081 [Paralvinella palmiformis]
MDKKKVKSSRSILEAEMNDYYAEPIETLTLASYSLENKWAEQLSNILVILLSACSDRARTNPQLSALVFVRSFRGSDIPVKAPDQGIGTASAPASAPTSPLRTRIQPCSTLNLSTFHKSGILFRPVKSCANLENMNSPPQHYQGKEVCPPISETSPGFLYSSIFKSVRSCINLEGMDRLKVQQPEPVEQSTHGKHSASGILFSSLKGFKINTNMVSERDINLIAPLSS